MVDQVISAGSYRVGRVLARGGMSQVRLGLDVRTGRAVAVKYLNDEFLRDENARRLFEAEATTAGLDHPGVVRVLDSGCSEDLAGGISVPYIVMEFVPGESLRTLLRRDGAVGPDAALDLTVQLLEALAYCHAAGVVHRDIKPSNVMVTPSGRIRLVDFGVARHVCGASEQLDGASQFVTTAYASPEQVQRIPTDGRSDLYSVGCVLYELLTGRPPFVGEAQDVLFERLVDEPRAPSDHNPEVGPDLDAVVLRSLRRDPGDRHPSAEAMKDDLQGVVRSRRAPAEPPPAVPRDAAAADWAAVTVLRPARPARRRTLRLISGMAAALLPIAGFGLFHLRGAEQMDGAAMAVSLGGVSGGTSAVGGSGSPPPALRSTAWVDQSCELAAEGVGVPARGAVEGVAGLALTNARSAGGARPGGAPEATRSGARTVGETSQPRPRHQSSEPSKPTKPKPSKSAEPSKPTKPKPSKPAEPSKPTKPKPSKPAEPPKPTKPKPSKPAEPEADQAEAQQAEAEQAEAEAEQAEAEAEQAEAEAQQAEAEAQQAEAEAQQAEAEAG